MRPPARESGATVSLRRRTPRARATTGMRNVVLEARLAAKWPAAFAISTFAMAVRKMPRASIDNRGMGVQFALMRSGMPKGAVRRIATAWARQMTGTAPYFCCRRRAMLKAMP